MTNNKLRVLLDCDGVLSDFIRGALRVVNDILDTHYVPTDVTAFDFCASLGLSPQDAARVKRAIGSTQYFAASLDVFPDAVDGVRRLREIADVYIVTSPWNSNWTWMSEREAWLARHFDIHHANVVHTSAKHVCTGDFLVDDKTETLERWQAAHPRGRAVQWVTPHNRRDGWIGAGAATWGDLISLVQSTIATKELERLRSLITGGDA